jgi:hypothetical protein
MPAEKKGKYRYGIGISVSDIGIPKILPKSAFPCRKISGEYKFTATTVGTRRGVNNYS